MIKIEYRPYKKLIILDIVKEPMQAFLDSNVYHGVQSNPKWCNGVLFIFASTSFSEYHQKKNIEEGILVWDYVSWTHMEKYQPTVRNDKTNSEVTVFDASNSPIYKEITKWLKKYVP